MRTLAIAVALFALMSSCSKSSNNESPEAGMTATSVSETIGAQGGEVRTTSSDGQGAALDIPAGAVSEDTTITIAPTEDYPVDDSVVPGTVYEFGPAGLVFDTPIELSIEYDPEKIPPTVAEGQLRVHLVVGGAWLEVPGGSADVAANTASAPVSHFSTYGIRGVTASDSPDAGNDAGTDPADMAVVVVPDMRTMPDVPVQPTVTCGGQLFACANGVDDDGDGKIDAEDPECLGACDNDEGSFADGVPGGNVDPCRRECYWDGNGGSGDDQCAWRLDCDPLSPAPSCPFDQGAVCNAPNAVCLSVCQPLVPNGCDCYGCCDVWDGAAFQTVLLEGGCSADDLTGCAACTKQADCGNLCEGCELCVGRGVADLPGNCGGVAECVGGTACVEHSDCPVTEACLTGCCVPSP